MLGVHPAFRCDGFRRRAQHLRQHLATINARAIRVGVLAQEPALSHLFRAEGLQQVIQCLTIWHKVSPLRATIMPTGRKKPSRQSNR